MTVVQATIIYLLVLLSGTPNTGYEAQFLFKTPDQKVCEAARQVWLDKWPTLVGLKDRLQCVPHRQKEIEPAFYE